MESVLNSDEKKKVNDLFYKDDSKEQKRTKGRRDGTDKIGRGSRKTKAGRADRIIEQNRIMWEEKEVGRKKKAKLLERRKSEKKRKRTSKESKNKVENKKKTK